MGARINLSKAISMRDTQANIESNSATLEEVVIAYATDMQQFGIYTNGNWKWFGNGTDGEILTDSDGNILVDDDGNVLWE